MSKLTSSEVIHNFAHQVKDKEKSGDYYYEGLELYRKGWYNDRLLTRIIDTKKKIVIIDNTFCMRGSFGNGHSAYTIKRAFDDKWIILNYIEINTLPDILTKNDWLKVILYDTKLQLENTFNRYIKEQELITNNKAFKLYYYGERDSLIILENIKYLCKKLKVKKSLILNHIYNDTHHCIVRQRGWGSRNSDWGSTKINKSIKYYLNPDKWWKPKQQVILEFKKWKSKYVDSDSGNELKGKTYKEIYFNPQLKEQFEEHMKLILKLREEKRIKDKEEYARKALEENKKRLEKWLNNEINYTYELYHVPIHLRLIDVAVHVDKISKVETIERQVETTLGVKVPLKHAELLFKKFKQCIDTNTEWQSNGHTIPIGNFKVEWIRLIGEKWALKAGCHTIFQEQIFSFVERNNLNWYGQD